LEADSPFAVAGSESAEVFELAEATLDAVSEFVECAVVLSLLLAATAGRDDGGSAEFVDGSDDGVRVVPLIGEYRFCLAALKQWQSLWIFRRLSCRETEGNWFSETVGQQVDLRAQSTSGTPQSLVFAPFLRPVAACW
jgi:hypothetical protein